MNIYFRRYRTGIQRICQDVYQHLLNTHFITSHPHAPIWERQRTLLWLMPHGQQFPGSVERLSEIDRMQRCAWLGPARKLTQRTDNGINASNQSLRFG